MSTTGSPSASRSTSIPRPGADGGAWLPFARGGSPVPWSIGDPGVEVARVHPQALRGTEPDMHDGRGDEARAACVLDRHLDAELDGDVADQCRARDAADPLQLDGDPVRDPVPVCPQQIVERDDRLVEHERAVARAAHRGALRVRAARLLEDVLEVAGRPQEAPCAAGREAAVRVGEEHDLVAHGVAHRREPLGVGLRASSRP